MSDDGLPSTGRTGDLNRGQCHPFKYLGLAHATPRAQGPAPFPSPWAQPCPTQEHRTDTGRDRTR